jgi:hypothetical protein
MLHARFDIVSGTNKDLTNTLLRVTGADLPHRLPIPIGQELQRLPGPCPDHTLQVHICSMCPF